MANIKFNLKREQGVVSNQPIILFSVNITDENGTRNIAADSSLTVNAVNDTDFTITTSNDTLNFTKKGYFIVIDDINVTSQSAFIIASILQEMFWQGTTKVTKLLDLKPKQWMRILPSKNQSEIQLDLKSLQAVFGSKSRHAGKPLSWKEDGSEN